LLAVDVELLVQPVGRAGGRLRRQRGRVDDRLAVEREGEHQKVLRRGRLEDNEEGVSLAAHAYHAPVDRGCLVADNSGRKNAIHTTRDALARHRQAQQKRRTREHVIADLSVNHAERHVLLCGYTAERRFHDYGLDLLVYTYNARGEVEPGEIHLQLKATDHLKVVASGTLIAQRPERRDVAAWLRQLMPVILVVYDAPADVAYWLHAQDHFARRPRFNPRTGSSTLTVRIPRSNVLNSAAAGQFALARDRVLAQARRSIHHHE
jgi:hypothetical protein